MSTSTANPSLTTLLARFRQARAATLAFTAPLSPEDMMVQSCAEASPIKWHLAHTSWFFETFVLTPYAAGYRPFHPDFHWLFNSYYNSLGDMPAKNLRSSFSRPPLADILAFRAHVDRAIADLLDLDPNLDLGEDEDEVLRRVALGIEHEQQHLELAAYDIKHALFTNPLHPAYKPSESLGAPRLDSEAWDRTSPTFTSFQGGLIEVGITPEPSDPLAFAFDNETPRHRVFLQPFALADRLVTVREYLAFIDDNGYTRPELWLSEGWTTCRSENWQAPLYWTRSKSADSGWQVYTLGGFKELDELAESPVCHLSFFEADAFARWSGCRLPTEFEWEHAAALLPDSAEANFLESGNLHPTACLSSHRPSTLSSRSAAKGSASSGLQQMFGDVWEWTASPYTGYPGYKPLPGALGEYNGKFMSSQIILRGGSCVTPATHIRATYRNFFSPATRWHFCGLRLAR
jgi:ergothioneine biosynthesis protein EgtB